MDPHPVSGFLKLIRKKRQTLGLTQQEVARRAKVSLATLQNIEAEKANPALSTVVALADVLGLEFNLKSKDLAPILDALCDYGLPLMSDRMSDRMSGHARVRVTPSRGHFIDLLNSLNLNERVKIKEDRVTDALSALLAAIEGHFPSIWRMIDHGAHDWLRHHRSVRPKLYRIASARLSEYL
jgi:transcriptional regulator with XRE-family HTH domain